MRRSAQFQYVEVDSAFGEFSSMPYMPMELAANGEIYSASALLDTGSAVNVLPYGIGERLGFVWAQQTTHLRLGGNLAHADARAVAVEAAIGSFAPVLLAFAWTRAENTPLLLGQVNFFREFEVCFYRGRGFFEVACKSI